MKKVGLPRALLYYKFSELWITFFKVLGAEVIISPPTNKSIKEKAIRIAPNEDCYSTKLYYGHVLFLKDKVDFLFIPRFGSKHKTNSGCPKFIGLSDVLKSMFPDLPEIIARNIIPQISKKFDIPVLSLVVDELTGEAGYQTRIEAFISLLERKRMKDITV
ncbi:MAG: hypothetical protein EAX90_14080 [Candidatus Heimdallarchaeota archaeon]|nr:hypothetical protein [Candidatus Heimdallarchaeota archaeon]